jgi:hypothetical protein
MDQVGNRLCKKIGKLQAILSHHSEIPTKPRDSAIAAGTEKG